jgi:hypothetical protein
MNEARRFILDSNVFIQAHRTYYAFDICPGFWDALVRQHGAKRLCSIDRIQDELEAINDQLRAWAAESVPAAFFKGTSDKKVVDAFREIANWVQNEPQFSAQAKSQFLGGADGWLIAFAKVNGMVVVSHEGFAPDAINRVPIPNVCIEFDAAFCNTFEMLHEIGEQFVLRHRTPKA